MSEPVYNLDDKREAAIVAWRITCFEGVGIGLLTASALAVRRNLDRPTVERLALAGATDDEIRRILAA